MPGIKCPVDQTLTGLREAIESGQLSNPRSRRIAEEVRELLTDVAWGRAGKDHLGAIASLTDELAYDQASTGAMAAAKAVREALANHPEVFQSHIDTHNCATGDCVRLVPAPCHGIPAELSVKENEAYYRALLFYKGARTEAQVLPEEAFKENTGVTVGYGLANFYLAEGQTARACALLRRLVQDEAQVDRAWRETLESSRLVPSAAQVIRGAVDRFAARTDLVELEIGADGQPREGRTITYGELYRATARFCSALTAQGLRPGDRVAALLHNSFELVITEHGEPAAHGPHDPVAFTRLHGGNEEILDGGNGPRTHRSPGRDDDRSAKGH